MSGDSKLTYKLQEWETGFFNCPFYFVTVPSSESVKQLRLLLATQNNKAYFTTLIPTEKVELIQVLEEHGFHHLATMVTLEREVGYPVKRSEATIVPVRQKDAKELIKIAKTAFPYGRFSAEKGLPKGIAEEMHATWAKNCCNKSIVDETLVALLDSKPVGFIGIRYREPGEINLIAVNSKFRGKGIGADLVESGVDYMAEMGSKKVIVRTEAPNLSAIRMYEKCGFKQINSSVYYGRFINEGSS